MANSTTSSCQQCGQTYQIRAEDYQLYEKFNVSAPQHCPLCRQWPRLAWRNERVFYQRHCQLCQRAVVTVYSPTGTVLHPEPYPVYCQACWWGDQWSPLAYGLQYDATRPFFEQYAQLQNSVPRVSLINTNSENSEYTHYTANNKNCYMVFSNSYGHNEDCYYGTQLSKCRNCVDAIQIENCELCYDCVDCTDSYGLVSATMCHQCTDSRLIEDCRGSKHCFMSKGLRNREYCILNKQYDQAGYYAELKNWSWAKAQATFSQFRLTVPSVATYQLNSEHCTGDYIVRSANCHDCFDTTDSEHCAYVQFSVNQNKDIYDTSYSGGSELSLENMGLVGAYHTMGSTTVWWNISNLYYSQFCFNGTKDSLGCIGLRGQQYCILNKQYTAQEYTELFNHIQAELQSTGVWGKFLPTAISPFGYNETIAQDFHPLTREAALAQGFNWNDQLPHTVSDQALSCTRCGKAFMLTKPEQDFYQQLELPQPNQCYNCRHLQRLQRRRSRQLRSVECAKCQQVVQTSYPVGSADLIYCQPCYNDYIY